jgi:hypothetical protein
MAIKARLLLAAVLLSGAVLMAGCSTAKGVAVGVGSTAEGIAEDAQNFWQGAVKLDDWMKKNLW